MAGRPPHQYYGQQSSYGHPSANPSSAPMSPQPPFPPPGPNPPYPYQPAHGQPYPSHGHSSPGPGYGAPPPMPPRPFNQAQQYQGSPAYASNRPGHEQYYHRQPSHQPYGPSYQQQPSPYPNQQGSYQSYQPQPGQHGGPPPPSQPAAPHQVNAYRQLLQAVVQEKRLQRFDILNNLDRIAGSVTYQVDELCRTWRVPREVGQDMVKLAMFDVILYIGEPIDRIHPDARGANAIEDDSGSMAFEEDGERIKDLKLILNKVAYAASLFDEDGISVHFMNSNITGDLRKLPNQPPEALVAQVEDLVSRVQFSGLTPMGTNLRSKIIDPKVVGPARDPSRYGQANLKKPILVITITDGQPAGEPKTAVQETVRYASTELQNAGYGPRGISFQFAQVGNDLKAREFLGKLDSDPTVGDYVDCTSNFEVEADEMSRAQPPVQLTVELWLAKLLLGAIDSSYDTKDEKTPGPSGGPGGPGGPPAPYPGGQAAGGYGGGPGYPPQGQPGYPQQQQYGQPPPQGYPQPPQQPGQYQSYGQPQQPMGQPPYSQGQRPPGGPQGYGQGQGQYPPQQGGNYQAPPPPPKY
ncbi:MAG: hypothetical protein M1833_003777 [Piccolia ochrophora]|nr:MAG: hypothetical protein M1833_003777 [Piccolia ochrophora]